MKEENKLSQPYADEEVSHLPQIKKEKEKKEQELTTRLKNNLVDLKKKKKRATQWSTRAQNIRPKKTMNNFVSLQ